MIAPASPPPHPGHNLSALLARLYRGIGEDPAWQDFLVDLARWMEAAYATLIITAPGRRRPATFVTPGANPAVSAAYAESLFADDPFRGLPDGAVVSSAEFMAGLPPESHPDYRRAMAEVGFDVVLGVDLHFGATDPRLRADDGRYEARLRVSRHRSQPAFSAADRAQLALLVPHLRIAVGLYERLQFAGAQHGLFHAAAQGLGIALVVLDRSRRIVSCNALAEQILDEDEGLHRSAGVLRFAEPGHQRVITGLLAGVVPPAPLPRFRIERPRHGDLVVTARPLDLRAIHAGTGALALFLRSNCIGAPHSIFARVHKVRPGHVVTLDLSAEGAGDSRAYWSLEEVIARPTATMDAGEAEGALEALRPQAVIVQVGLGGDIQFPANLLVGKELDWRGAFRFHEEFAMAVELMNRKLVDVKPLITATYPIAQAVEAFEIAGDRSKMMKVQISFD